MSEKALGHLRIIANAGAGKTYRLVTRYIELLARGVAAESIIALTFTRKAAREFLDNIFERLLVAIESQEEINQLKHLTGVSELSQAQCRLFLRELVDKLHLLTLGTMDSFFGRIVRAFPFECGITEGISILDEATQDRVRRETLSHLFHKPDANTKGFQELTELIRQINRNQEERSILLTLERQVKSLHEQFLITPSNKPWGDPEVIWPEGCAFLEQSDNLSNLAREFKQAVFSLHGEKMEPKHQKVWEQLFDAIARLQRGMVVPKELINFSLQLIESREATENFEISISRKKFEFPAHLRDLAYPIGRSIIHQEIEGKLARSQALFHLLALFENNYQQKVRASGQLTFSDITGILAAASGVVWGGRISQRLNRREIDFRLDASYNHWLLDEFQDTSRLQWHALQDLADEIIQSDSGERSFFYVGDAKQAIYSWRGGDSRLFDEIANYYNASGSERIATNEVLSTSYRSAPEILNVINTIFSPENLQKNAEKLNIPSSVLSRWDASWSHHESDATAPNCGSVVWKIIESEEDEKDRLSFDREVVRLIKEVNPTAKGWSCAVLVRSNARITPIIHALRLAGLPATEEGKFFPCVDNELGMAFLSLFRLAAHPDDLFSLKHVRMTPLANVLNDDDFSEETLALVASSGFAAVVQKWLGKICHTLTPFLHIRAADFSRAAAEFDLIYSGGQSSVDEFIRFAEKRQTTDQALSESIRVMSIHASKGLDFDMVVLPDLESETFPSRKEDSAIFLQTDKNAKVLWGFDLPVKDICFADNVLRQAYEEDAAEQCYERICLYYVAMTRAKRGLYLFSNPLKKESKARNFNRLLHESLPLQDGKYIEGIPQWHEKQKNIISQSKEKNEQITFPTLPRISENLPLIRPSTAPQEKIAASDFFSDERRNIDFGIEVHQALTQIEWLSETPLQLKEFSSEITQLVSNFLDSHVGKNLFRRPPKEFKLWREQPFNVLVEEKWISGIFDRVVLYLDLHGKVEKAEIIDFKSDYGELSEMKQRYQSQLLNYRHALSKMLAIAETSISTKIVGLRLQALIEV